MKDIRLDDMYSVFSHRSGREFGPALHSFNILIETQPGYGSEIEEEVFWNVLGKPNLSTLLVNKNNPYRGPVRGEGSYITHTKMDGNLYTIILSGYGTERSIDEFADRIKKIELQDGLGPYWPVWEVKTLVGTLPEGFVVRVNNDFLNGTCVPDRKHEIIDAIFSMEHLKYGPKR